MDGMEELEKCPIGASNWLIITIRCTFWCKYKQIKMVSKWPDRYENCEHCRKKYITS